MFETHNTTAIIAIATILASTGLGVFARVVTRNDGHQHIEISDFSVSLEVIIALIGVLAAETFEYFKHKDQLNIGDLTMCMFGLMGLMFWLWCISTLIRKIGWKNDKDLHPLWGVFLPNILSFIALWYFFELFNFLYL